MTFLVVFSLLPESMLADTYGRNRLVHASGTIPWPKPPPLPRKPLQETRPRNSETNILPSRQRSFTCAR